MAFSVVHKEKSFIGVGAVYLELIGGAKGLQNIGNCSQLELSFDEEKQEQRECTARAHEDRGWTRRGRGWLAPPGRGWLRRSWRSWPLPPLLLLLLLRRHALPEQRQVEGQVQAHAIV